jgi:hypothetical protein
MSSSSSTPAVAAVDPAVALQQAMQQMGNMHAEMQRMQAHSQALQSQLNAAAAASAGQVLDRNLPKIPSPVPFLGVSGPAVEEFVNSVDRQFEYYVSSFAKEETRLRYVVNYLHAKAASWYTSTKVDLDKAGTAWTTWAELKEALRDRFQPIGSAVLARESLDRSSQKGSVASYTEFFYRCMTYIKDMSVADQVHQYGRGLKKEIRQEVIREQPSTLADAIMVAHKAESFLNIGSFTTSHGRSVVPRFQGYSASSGGSSGGSSAMDINNIELDPESSDFAEDRDDHHRGESARIQQLASQVSELKSQQKVQQSLLAMFQGRSNGGASQRASNGGGALVSGVSKEDYARCRSENRCLNCRTIGHVARDCTKPRSFKW